MADKPPRRSPVRTKRGGSFRFPFGLLTILDLMGRRRGNYYREQSQRIPYRTKAK